MVSLKECVVTRKEAKVTVQQRDKDVVIINEITEQFTTIPNELLPDLSGLLEYIAGYQG